jgi:predicted Zn-dependent protease
VKKRSAFLLYLSTLAVLLFAFLLNTDSVLALEPPTQSRDNYFDEIIAGTYVRWPVTRTPIKVFIESGSSVPGYRQEFKSILLKSFDAWQQASNARIKFSYVDSAEAADIKCIWTDDIKQMMSSAEGGHALVVPDAKGICQATITILTKSMHQPNEISVSEMQRICLHEIGHALGITAHSPISNDIMYARTTSSDANNELTQRDKNTLFMLYSANIDHPIDASKAIVSGDSSNPHTQALKLNNEAAVALQQKNYTVALQKLESAHNLDPGNDLVNTNLGAIYSNLSAMGIMLRNFPAAETYINKAIPILEHNSNKANLIAVLKNYATLLRFTNRTAEAKIIDQRIQRLESENH